MCIRLRGSTAAPHPSDSSEKAKFQLWGLHSHKPMSSWAKGTSVTSPELLYFWSCGVRHTPKLQFCLSGSSLKSLCLQCKPFNSQHFECPHCTRAETLQMLSATSFSCHLHTAGFAPYFIKGMTLIRGSCSCTEDKQVVCSPSRYFVLILRAYLDISSVTKSLLLLKIHLKIHLLFPQSLLHSSHFLLHFSPSNSKAWN